MGRSKVGPFGAIVIILLGVALIGGIIYYIFVQNRDTTRYFYLERRSTGQRILNEIHSYDLIRDYPDTPQEVIRLNNLLMQMIYGRIVSNDDLLYELVGIQQMIFSDFIQTNNSHQSRFEILFEDTAFMYENNIYLWSIEPGLFFESDELNMASVPITMTFVTNSVNWPREMYWNYFLRHENGRWKIYDMKRMDSTFRNPYEG